MLNDLKLRVFSLPYILGWVVSSVVTALVGPFDTYSISPIGDRLLFFGGILLVALIGSAISTISFSHLFPRWHLMKLSVVSCSVFIMIYWLFILAVSKAVYGHLVLPHPALLFVVVAGVSATIYSFVYMLSPQTISNIAPNAKAAIAPAPIVEKEVAPEVPDSEIATPCAQRLFLQRIGPDAGERLIRMAMRDHYIEVYSNTGQTLVHMRFSDAVNDLSDFNGDQIHRSHWINFGEIDGIVKESGKMGFRMSDGSLVPIARSRKPKLKELGLI